jgi:SAM-dependent methyltransferase
MTPLTSQDDARMRAAYNASAIDWERGPASMYERLADHVMAAGPLAGARVLDVGAGTGAASRAALRAGARWVVAADLAENMLRRLPATVPAVVADATALPFPAETFDSVVAHCCLGHVPDPVRLLRETRRVGTTVLASAFGPYSHPAKAVVEDVLATFGYRVPEWYATFKRELEPVVGDPVRLSALAVAAGYPNVAVVEMQVETGLGTPEQLVAWRFGMAHIAPFVTALAARHRQAAFRAACQALQGAPKLVIPLVVLSASRAVTPGLDQRSRCSQAAPWRRA